MNDGDLFGGIAVVVDDEVKDALSSIGQICSSITNGGSHVIGLTTPPTTEQIKTLSGVSFFVVDWNLDESTQALAVEGIKIPASVRKSSVKKTLQLLKDLKENRVAPIFVFTSGDVEDVKQKIQGAFPDGGHLLVKSKSEVIDEGVNNVLGKWVKTSAAAYVLRHWEKEYDRAKQAFFKDFYTKSIDWPVILWKTFDADGVPASDELGRLILRNIQSRMTPFDFALKSFVKPGNDALSDRTTVLEVLEGERYITNGSLHEASIAPGDIFKDGKTYYINIRPECDCVARSGDSVDELELYLLRGSKLTTTQQSKAENTDYGRMDERDGEAIIYPINDGKGVSFQFRDIVVNKWADIKDKRIGRVLPPFITRLQERFSAYLQRPGLSRYPAIAFTNQSGSDQAEAQVAMATERVLDPSKATAENT